MRDIRTCAKCGNNFPEIKIPWPQFPMCSLCEEKTDRSPANVFKMWLQVKYNIMVTVEQAKDIMDTVNGRAQKN